MNQLKNSIIMITQLNYSKLTIEENSDFESTLDKLKKGK